MQAIKLYKRATPESIISSRQLLLQQCITPCVELRAGVWHYPEPQVLGPGLWSQRRFQALMQQLTRLPLPGVLEYSTSGLGQHASLIWCCCLSERHASCKTVYLHNGVLLQQTASCKL